MLIVLFGGFLLWGLVYKMLGYVVYMYIIVFDKDGKVFVLG